MALRKQRGRNQAYDNAVVGTQTTSFECTSNGNVPPVELAATVTGFRDNLSVGKPEFVQGAWIKTGAVVIDAGYNPGNVGDVEYAERSRGPEPRGEVEA